VTDFLQHLVNGVSQGAIFALIALGYTMVYGVLQLINFAHGDVFMVGAMVGYYATVYTGAAKSPSIPSAIGITLLAMLACGLLGFTIERVAYRPLRGSPRLNSLITAIGVSFLLEYGGQATVGPNPRKADVLPVGTAVTFGGISIGSVDVVIIVVSCLLMFALQRIVFHSRIGTAMRAVSWNPSVAALMGVNVDRVISFTFVLGSTLAAVAGILYSAKYAKVEPLMGLMPGLKAFVAAVLGGIGNVPGAMLGGLLLGVAEQLVSGYVSSSWKDAIAFAILILILLVKPTGLLGRGQPEKV
jgi:branched-chain amino acid transport system permease protein